VAEVILSSEELTVLGGPAEISVDLDFGPQGDRGSLILYGLGKPTAVVLPETPQVYDVYVNLLTSDDEYMFMYQYISAPGGNTWTKLFKLTPNMYSGNSQRLFEDGEVQINLPVAAIVPADQIGNITSSNFNVQFNVLNTNPLATSMSIGDLSIYGGLLSLPIYIKAQELVDSEMVPLEGSKTVHLLITVV
jgi:hypothetical protein